MYILKGLLGGEEKLLFLVEAAGSTCSTFRLCMLHGHIDLCGMLACHIVGLLAPAVNNV